MADVTKPVTLSYLQRNGKLSYAGFWVMGDQAAR